jgi:bifunctional dethiobiotin synthetase / adenosylmethionine---8-amino-7-oxononanoate aminotransferase
MESTGPLLGVYPDISVNAKVLTGGLIPLAVTLASQSIFEAFLSDNKAEALLHGHSYTAHAIGCEVANETLSLIDKLSTSEDWLAAQASWEKSDGQPSPVWSLWDPNFITAISKLPQVKEAMTLGSVLAIKVQDTNAGKIPSLVILVTSFSQSHYRLYFALCTDASAIPKYCFARWPAIISAGRSCVWNTL